MASKGDFSLITSAQMSTISFDRAKAILDEWVAPSNVEECKLDNACGRVVAAGLKSQSDLPPFDNSAVDGFAICDEDRLRLESERIYLEWSDTIHAGHQEELPHLVPGKTVRVMTGAPIPPPTSAVVMQEEAHVSGQCISLSQPIALSRNIRHQGEECHEGADIVMGSTVVTPAVQGHLAGCGYHRIEVFRNPRIGVLITGSEIVPTETVRNPFQCFDSVGPSLAGAFKTMGLDQVAVQYSCDDNEKLAQAIDTLLDSCDVLVTVGGVSAGDKDFVRQALASSGIEMLIEGVAMRPGKPFIFGHKAQQAVFGLPGNPLAAMISYLVFVQPFLRKLMHVSFSESPSTAELTHAVRSKIGQREFVPGLFAGGNFEPAVSRTSSMLGGLARSNALACVREEVEYTAAREPIEILPIRWEA